MFKSTTKAFVLALLVFVLTVGAAAMPSNLAVTVSKPTPTSPGGNVLVTSDGSDPDKVIFKWKASTPVTSLDHYEIQLSTDAGFTGAIWEDVGTGVEMDLNAMSFAPLTRSRTYYWRMRACDATECTTPTSTLSFRVSVGAPTLVAPADGSYLETNRDTFKWNQVLNATGYTLQVSAASNFSSVILQQEFAGTTTQYTPINDLPVNQELFWRVQAKNATYGPGPWSEVWSFVTAVPPTIPTLLQPRDKKMTTDYSPRLVWSQVTLPSATTFQYYQVQIDKVKTFDSAALIDDTTVADIATPYYDVDELAPLDAATTYYWRVRACNGDGVNTYCSAWPAYFTLYTSLDAPVLNDPVDGANLDFNRPLFDWDDVYRAVRYTLQLSKDPDFKTISNTWVATTSQYRPSVSLAPDTTYYWRVQGWATLYGPGLMSPVFSFHTANPPARPVLVSPANNSLVRSTTPRLSWKYSVSPAGTTFDYYQVQIDIGTSFTAPIEDAQVMTQFTPYFDAADYTSTLNPINKYYWRVRACNIDAALNSGCSEWSPVWSMRIAAEAPINLDSSGYPLLAWDPVAGASSYYVEIYSDASGRLVRTVTTLTNQAIVLGLKSGDMYDWRVRVKTTYAPGFAPGEWSAFDTLIVP